DFQRLQLFSVNVNLEYKEGGTNTVKGFSFRSPNDAGHFASFIENGNRSYSYWYQVNYKNQSQTYKSPVIVTKETNLDINIGDLGVLAVDVRTGDLNFNQVSQTLIDVRYADTANGIAPIEQQFIITKDNKTQEFLAFLFQPRQQKYTYSIRYQMADGKEFLKDGLSDDASAIFIDNPFSDTKTIGIRTALSFTDLVDTIFVDLKYVDEQNRYEQRKSIALTKDQQFTDWSFP